jgi:alcohol dehydrogenase
MRALFVDAFGAPPVVRDVPEPSCPPDGMVIEVRATGLCRSDWHAWAGHDPDVALPHVPGHEFAGVVHEVGADVTRVQIGDRVTVPFVCACGRCATCRTGAPQVCEDQFQPGFTGWGSFAERVAVPRADGNAVPLPEDVDFVSAAGLGCRFATAYRAVAAHARLAADEWLMVVGCGGIGLAATMIASVRGARVLAVDLSEDSLAFARRFGAAATLVAGADLPAAAREVTDGGPHATLDAIGSAAVLRDCIESLRPRGRHVQVGLLVGPDATPPVPMARVLAKELEIYGSHGMGAADYAALLAEIAAGRLDPGAMVTEQLPLTALAGAEGALAGMGNRPATGTVVVVF